MLISYFGLYKWCYVVRVLHQKIILPAATIDMKSLNVMF